MHTPGPAIHRDPRITPVAGDRIRTTSGDIYEVVYSEAGQVSRHLTRPDGQRILDVVGPISIWREWADGADVLVAVPHA